MMTSHLKSSMLLIFLVFSSIISNNAYSGKERAKDAAEGILAGLGSIASGSQAVGRWFWPIYTNMSIHVYGSGRTNVEQSTFIINGITFKGLKVNAPMTAATGYSSYLLAGLAYKKLKKAAFGKI